MNSQQSYPYHFSSSPSKQLTTSQMTSSAFSPSANPNEDWTKISDLAERRRIQNRIAQRNYRKKLKKRLEDLERRAGSSSASPEQSPSTPPALHNPQSRHSGGTADRVQARSSKKTVTGSRTASGSLSDDRSMFSQQHLRQLSTSPPLFPYAAYSSSVDTPSSNQYTTSSYTSRPNNSTDLQSYTTYLPPFSQGFPNSGPSKAMPIKKELYNDEEINPFSMSYASMAGVDMSYGNAYRESMIHTPPLSDSYEPSCAGSPSAYPTFLGTSISLPMTPPLQVYER